MALVVLVSLVRSDAVVEVGRLSQSAILLFFPRTPAKMRLDTVALVLPTARKQLAGHMSSGVSLTSTALATVSRVVTTSRNATLAGACNGRMLPLVP